MAKMKKDTERHGASTALVRAENFSDENRLRAGLEEPALAQHFFAGIPG